MSALGDVAVGRLRDSGCIVLLMRILVADRNAFLLEAISRTFERQFNIQTATSCERCKSLLLRAPFNLAIIGEQLADAPGLQLLQQIAQSFPATLRVFAATRSRLQLLEDELGSLGIFRTVPYPIRHPALVSVLNFTRAGLEAEAAARPTHARPIVAHKPLELARKSANGTTHASRADSHAPAGNPDQQIVSPSPLSTEALPSSNMPEPIASTRHPAPSRVAPAPSQQPHLGHGSTAPLQTTRIRAGAPDGRTPRQRPRTSLARRAVLEMQAAEYSSRSAAWHARKKSVAREFVEAARRVQAAPSLTTAPSRAATAPSAAEKRPARVTVVTWRAASSHLRSQAVSGSAAPAGARSAATRARVSLRAAILLVLLVTMTPLELFDARLHMARASRPWPELETHDMSGPPQNSTPARLTAVLYHAPAVAQGVEPGADVANAGAGAGDPPISASITPVADPSSFGSEAYEPIYAD